MNIKVKLSHSALKLNKKFKLFGLKYNCKEFVGNSSNCNNKFTVHIDHCQFNYNHIYSLISSVLPTKEYIKSKSIVIFSNCIFFNNNMFTNHYLIENIDELDKSIWLNCSFVNNSDLKLITIKPLSNPFLVIIIKNVTISLSILHDYLIDSLNAHLVLYGPVKFISINSSTYILFIREITCYEYVELSYNYIEGFVLQRIQVSIRLLKNTMLKIQFNTFLNDFASSKLTRIIPYPICLFQYFTNHTNLDAVWYQEKKLNYSITFNSNNMKPLAYSKIATCGWLNDSAFHTARPQEINQNIITFEGQQATQVENNEICLCKEHFSFDCAANELGPIYPGEMLVVKFAFPFAWNYSQYVGKILIYGDRSKTTCQYSKVTDHMRNKPVSLITKYHYCNETNFTILASQEKWCALVLYTFDDIKTKIGVFYIILFPGCPMGFAKYYNKCDCDQLLGMLLTITCNINDRTILRPGNSWINATTNNYSHNYTVCQDCPFGYCLPQSSHLHLSYPNSQCQFNRTGLLCGQCQQGLSTVFGSSQCQQCSNIYVLFIILFAVLGILLVFVLFAINITVTDGTINAFVFYINIVSIDGSIFFPHHWFSYVFISIANLDWGMKTCFYNGMDDYAKI